MSPFQSQLKLRSRRPVGIKKVNIYCDCRLPEDEEEPMVYCEGCKNWYHRSCQSIPDIVFGFAIIVQSKVVYFVNTDLYITMKSFIKLSKVV